MSKIPEEENKRRLEEEKKADEERKRKEEKSKKVRIKNVSKCLVHCYSSFPCMELSVVSMTFQVFPLFRSLK